MLRIVDEIDVDVAGIQVLGVVGVVGETMWKVWVAGSVRGLRGRSLTTVGLGDAVGCQRHA